MRCLVHVLPCQLTLLVCLLQSCSQPSVLPSTAVEKTGPEGSGFHACEDGYRLQYKLTRPAESDDGTRVPLLLCLHGVAGGTQAPRALRELDGPSCFVLVPSVPSKEFSWGPKRRNGLPYVFELVDDLLENEAIDPDRIYVTGQSMGGFGTFAAVASRPDFFAAAVPVCGGWKTADASRMHKVPMWVFHGEADKVVPVRYSREMVKALRAAGGQPRYTEFSGVGHNSWVKAYESEELWIWLFEQHRGSADSARH